MAVFSHFLDHRDLEELRRYKFTFLDHYMNVFWNWAAESLPKTVAPNVLTLLALFSSFACAAISVYFAPTLTEDIPPLALFISIGFLFCYQTLDALDGKQARNTKSSSPLGQLFDHGCDSLTASLLAVAGCGYLGMGNSIWTYMMVLGVQLPVLVLNWHEIHSHVFLTSTGDLGVTEGQFATMGLGAWVAIFGRGFWAYDIFAFPTVIADFTSTPFCQPRHILAFCFLMTSFQIMVDTVPVSMAKTDKPALALQQLLSFFVWIIATGASFFAGCYDRLGIFAWSFFALTFSSIATRLVISATVKKDFAPIQTPLVPYYIMTGVVYFINRMDLNSIFTVAIPDAIRPYVPGLAGIEGVFMLQDILFIAHAVFVVAYFSYYIYTTITDITKCLGIYAFSLDRREPMEPIDVFNKKKRA